MQSVLRRLRGSAAVSALVLGLPVLAAAQFNTGSITGTVTDQSGGVIPGATVTVTNTGTNVARTSVTDAGGRYDAPALETGTYRVEAALEGFQDSRVDAIRLSVGDRARVDLKLSVGVRGESVTVEAAATRINSETSFIGDTIDQARVANLPINGRDFTSLLATVPGSVQSGSYFNTSVNGVPTWFGQSIMVDGIDAGRGDLNGVSNVLGRIDSRVNRASIDSIQEVQVIEQTYGAQYGQAIGAIVNAITKSGTNQWHGGAFEYFRDDALDARDFFASARNVGNADFRMNQFGGNVAGPIVKDKAFFFFNYEGVRQNKDTVLQGFVPTQAFRDTFRPAMAPVLAKLPLPNTAYDTREPRLGLYSAIGARELREDTGSLKADFNLTDADRLAIRYNLNDSETITPYGAALGQVANGSLRVQLLKVTHTRTLSSRAFNELAVGLNRNVTYPDGGDTSLPVFNFAFIDGAMASPGPARFAQYRQSNIIQILDTLNLVTGSHSFKIGTDIRLNRRRAEVDEQIQLLFFSLADLANNAPFSADRIGTPMLYYENENYSFFVQDDWRIHPRVTINAGVRYDVSSTSRERDGRLRNFDPETGTYTPLGAKVHNPDTNNIAPRVGFAWDVRGSQKTVVRGGYGLFYNQELPASFGSPHNNTFPDLAVNIFDGIALSFPLAPDLFANAPPSARAINIIDPDLETPYAHQFSANVQQDIGLGVVQIGYVGNRVRRMTAGSSITALNLNRTNPFTGLRPDPSRGNMFLIAGYPKSNYDALQAGFKRVLTSGLGVNVSYTYAVQKDDAIGFLQDYQDTTNPDAEWGPGDHDLRHNLAFDLIYNVPRSALPFLPERVAEGWQLASITQVRSGMPVNVTVTGGFFGGSLRPNVVPGVSSRPDNDDVPNRQFNPDAFVAPPAGQYGNLGRNALRGPGFFQVDLSLSKSTRIANGQQLQFRIETFNLFNRANFSVPFGGLNRDPLSNGLSPSVLFGQSWRTVGDEQSTSIGPGGPRQIQLSLRYSF